MNASTQTLRSAWREVKVVAVVWLLAAGWTMGYLVYYPVDASVRPRLILGIPLATFYGVLLPWILLAVFTAIYTLSLMSDDELEPATVGETC
jgi:hypothetical protein